MSEPIRAGYRQARRPPAGDVTGGHNLIGNIGTGTATGACSGLANGVNRAATPTAAQINTHTG